MYIYILYNMNIFIFLKLETQSQVFLLGDGQNECFSFCVNGLDRKTQSIFACCHSAHTEGQSLSELPHNSQNHL